MFLSQLSPTSWNFTEPPAAQFSLIPSSSLSRTLSQLLSFLWRVWGWTERPNFDKRSISWKRNLPV
jgi:hypothetical protein